MLEIKGKYSTAKIMCDEIEDTSYEQILELCNQSFTKDCKVRIMPDVHSGKGCVIGFTADLGDIVIPNLVGVDIGCSVFVVELGNIELDLAKLDEIINAYIPSGTKVHEGRVARFPKMQQLESYRSLKDNRRIERSLGTLGGGNHFIEVDQDDDGNKYLVIHTGSRGLGKQVAEYYQQLAIDLSIGKENLFDEEERIIREYKEQDRRKEIKDVIKQLEANFVPKEAEVEPDLAYLYGKYRDKYIHDIAIVQEFSKLNRRTIANIILEKYFDKTLDDFETFETMHNYIDVESNVIRKGAVSAKLGEKLIIPINMKDGALICIGKGNKEWNESAPHGAGRIFSRDKAREELTLEDFQKSMEGIYTSCVGESTLDEAPMAYKTMEHILQNVTETVEINKIIKPIYNFKAH